MKILGMGFLACLVSFNVYAQSGSHTIYCGSVQKTKYSPNLLNRLIVRISNARSHEYIKGVWQQSKPSADFEIKFKGKTELEMLSMDALFCSAQSAVMGNFVFCTTEWFWNSEFIYLSSIGRTETEALSIMALKMESRELVDKLY